MDWGEFEHYGYLSKKRLCGSSRTRLTGTISNEEKFGVSVPNKIRGQYYNYIVEHNIVEKDFFWKVENMFGDKKEDSWHVYIYFSPNESKLLENLQKTLWYYTTDSVSKALRTTPELARFIDNIYGKRNYYNKEIHSNVTNGGVYLVIYNFNIGTSFPESTERADSEALFQFAKLISSEIRALSIDTSKLVKKPKEEPLLPKWLENTLRTGAKVGIKYLCASIGAKIDFPDFGGDNSNNVPDFDGDFDADGDFDFDNDGDSDFDIGGLAFQGKHFNGFEDLGKTITVPIMGGGGSDTLFVYKKLGSSTIYVSDGSCYPVSIAGHSWITVGSHKFDVSKINAKL